ncbi:hypothetical protein CUR178_05849 [Leishmania enriettii]|uniref:Tubulin--tyrosine ligase-like protein 5 n=1 Tax=Leishmania enriettii TaxID=5663 RepID=A0A836GX21_LEIEN|nr:hypothetical protein CUR178_05849 [Leishmania enriettii]
MSAGGVDQEAAWSAAAPLSTLKRCGGDGEGDVAAAAARRARCVLEPFLVSPSVVLDPCSITSADENAGLASTDVYLVDSPYERRRPTIAFVPYDKPAAGDKRHRRSEEAGDGSAMVHFDVLVQPDKLPSSVTDGVLGGSGEGDPEASLQHDTKSKRRVVARASTGPYSRLSYIMDESCTPFTALLATLRAAGFTRVSGRAALLHKTHSLLWAKHLLPSMVDQLLRGSPGAYRKVNHFPGTHALGRKDKLCLLLRRAGQRWQAGGEHSTVLGDAYSTRAVAWAALTPESWLLPHEADACVRALQQPAPSAAAAPLFIVKPTNQAGGQGIFLIRGGSEAGVASLAAAVGGLGGNTCPSKFIDASTTVSSKLSPGIVPCRRARTASLSRVRAANATLVDASAAETARSSYVVQRYMTNPFLLGGRKFDLRLYVVATSYDPVRLYLYREGLVRIASSPYTRTTSAAASAAAAADTALADVSDLRAHLTNFTLSKGASSVPRAERGAGVAETGAETGEQDLKWPLSSLAAYVASMGYDWPRTLQRIHELLRLVFLAVTPEVRAGMRASLAGQLQNSSSNLTSSPPSLPAASSYATVNGASPFFEIFGVDVLLIVDNSEDSPSHDSAAVTTSASTLRPVLLEVNIMPSLSTHYSILDQRIKANFIADALTLVGLMPPPPKAASSAPGARDIGGGERRCYNDPFLDGLNDSEAVNVCLTTEEESRRAENFIRLLPTRDSASKYRSLLEATEGSLTSTTTSSRFDAVLSSWIASSP